MDIGIKGFGAYSPERVVTNAHFESYLDTSDEWIKSRLNVIEQCGDHLYHESFQHILFELSDQPLKSLFLELDVLVMY